MARKNTDKVDADILCRILKMQVLSGEMTISPVTVPSEDIQELRGLFSTYRLYRKQTTQIKNRIHSLLKERLYGFTREEIFTQKSRKMVRGLESSPILSFQVNELLDHLEGLEGRIETLQDKIKEQAAPYMREIEILTSMKGVSVFIAIAIIADIIRVDRFKDSKSFTSYLRSAPKVSIPTPRRVAEAQTRRGEKSPRHC